MLHEIFLSLSGHTSPLLTSTATSPNSSSVLSPSEKALLTSIAHLSDLHCKLLSHTTKLSSSHRSSICQAVALAIRSTHLAKFQQKVLEVEDGILRKDAGSVGAYNIVPLTAIVGEFSDWTRRMEWLWEIAQFMSKEGCTGAKITDKLCDSLRTGYSDIKVVALHLTTIAETAWLKQASGWILYGRLPFSGKEDFFVHQGENGQPEEYVSRHELCPAFISTSTAASILFIGRSLNHIQVKGDVSSNSSLGLVPSHLRMLSSLSFPIAKSSLSSMVSEIRLSLSQNALRKLLPLSRIQEILALLHEYFLLGRGEFAIALISEADENIRNRWRRNDNLAYDKRDKLSNIVIKDGEVSAVLARTWTAMSSLQGVNDDEDRLDLARDLVHLNTVKGVASTTPLPLAALPTIQTSKLLARTAFNKLLFSIPTQLSLHIPSPLDLFLTSSEVQIYSIISSYLISIRRAHLRLSDLWKITSLRRDHPAPPAAPYGSSTRGRAIVQKRRARAKDRGTKIRSVWATSSAAVFILGETEAYFHGEVIQGVWSGFQQWLTGMPSRPGTALSDQQHDDVWTTAGSHPRPTTIPTKQPSHDPQTLSDAHKRCLDCLAKDLLLTSPSFTEPLYHLLQQIDQLVALVHRIHSIWHSLDLEADEGVVDAFSDFHKEEKDVEEQLEVVAGWVKDAIEVVIKSLRDIDQEKDNRYHDGFETTFDDSAYVPQRMGRVHRLLMKLDFGDWFNVPQTDARNSDDESSSDDE